MKGQILLPIIVFVPVLGAFILPLLGTISVRLRNLLALLLVSVSFVGAAMALPSALSAQPIQINIPLPLNLNFGFLGDGLAVFMAMTSSFVGAIIVLYSFGYINHYKNQNEYYFLAVLY